jgi:hypothetical protein
VLVSQDTVDLLIWVLVLGGPLILALLLFAWLARRALRRFQK